MESNLEQQTPKLNVTNISSAVFGKDGPALGKESKIGTLSRILRTTRLKVNNLEKVVVNQEKLINLTEEKTNDNTKKNRINAEKITRLKNIFQNQKSGVGEKLPGSGKDNLNTTLLETNRILVEIQKQLAYDFAMRAVEEKKEAEDEKKATSKSRFEREETALEKSEEKEGLIKAATKKIVSPIGNIFKKLVAFLGILGKGIAVNAAFEFFKDEENQKKITKFFNILKENWQLLAKILGTLVIADLAIKLAGALLTLKSILLLVANPMFLAGVGVIIAAARQGLGREQKEVLKYLEDELGGITVENRKKMIELLESQREPTLPDGKPNPDYIPPFLLAPRAEIDRKIRFLKTGEYDYGGKKAKLDFGFSEFLTITQGSKYNFDTGEIESTSPDGSKPGIDLFRGKREMGGPVTAGQSYLVGEGGPEIFSPNINGSIVNNMRTEKIYQMIKSGKKGRTRIIELPPQTIEGPKPEIKLPQGPATKAPKISSSNSLDGYRSVTSEIYGIMV